MTINKKSISYNLIVLNGFNAKCAPCFSAGIYVCMLMSKHGNPSMFFFDYKIHPENVADMLNTMNLEDEFKQKYRSLIEVVNAAYKRNISAIDLIVGEAPVCGN